MALSDCEKCWETPCICGHDYRDWPVSRLQELISALEKVMALRSAAKTGGSPMTTIFRLNWGANGYVPETNSFFRTERYTDAVVRLAEVVYEMDRNSDIICAFASLTRLPDSIYPEGMSLVSWTKTSNERLTEPGFSTEEEARNVHQ